MRNTILISLSAIATSGCIIYDNDGPNRGKDDPTSVIETGEVDNIELDLMFSPPQAEVGEDSRGRLRFRDPHEDHARRGRQKERGEEDVAQAAVGAACRAEEGVGNEN